MSYLDDVRDAVAASDAAHARSQQVDIGWSEMHDCRQHLNYRLSGAWATDDTDNWRAAVGTTLHAEFARIVQQVFPTALVEVEVKYRGVLGHADLIDPGANSVTDFKFPTLAVLSSWSQPEAFEAKRVQVHGYAAGAIEQAILSEDCTVRVIACPVDGGYSDWWVWEEKFDRDVADRALNRLEQVRDGHVSRDKPYAWCQRFCEFFSLCRDPVEPESEDIVDPELAAMVDRYGQIGEVVGPLTSEKKRIARELRGIRGTTTSGWRVGLTRPSGTKFVPDMEQIKADYRNTGVDVPAKEVPTSAPSLYVRRVKKEEES